MKIGCCSSDDVDGHIRALKAGFDYTEVSADVLRNDEEYEKLREAVLEGDARPEVLRDFVPDDIPVIGEEADFGRLDEITEEVCERAEELGAEIITFTVPEVPIGFSDIRAGEQVAEFLAEAGKTAAAHGITVALEPIGGITEGLKVIRAVGSPFVKLILSVGADDAKEDVTTEIAKGGEDIVHVRVASADEGVCAELFDMLSDVGYDDRVSALCGEKDMTRRAEMLRKLCGAAEDAEAIAVP